jgi:hypothetical protein
MQSHDTDIGKILEDIDSGEIRLPEFQRNWVWDDKRIRSLIASILNAYPIGAVMFMTCGNENINFQPRHFTSSEGNNPVESLVLDGQQRLTSIYTAMFRKEAVPALDEHKRPIKRFYYLDMELCLKSIDDKTIDLLDAVISMPESKINPRNSPKYKELDLSMPEYEYKNMMFPLNNIFDTASSHEWHKGFRQNCEYNEKIIKNLDKFTDNFVIDTQNYRIPVITLGKKMPREAICKIFEDVNTGGVSLSIFELVTAIFAAVGFDLRKDWLGRQEKGKHEEYVEGRFQKKEMKEELRELLKDVDGVAFLRAVTLLSRYHNKLEGGKDAPAVSCTNSDVLRLTSTDYKKYADNLTEGFRKAAAFVYEQHIFTKFDLPYSTQLIPLAVLFSILDKRSNEHDVRKKLYQWYWCGVLGEMYGGANETRYVNDVVGVMAWIDEKDEPEKSKPDTVQRAYFESSRLLTLQRRNSAAYKGIFALILQKRPKDFLSGKDMDHAWFIDDPVDIHHIFPRKFAESKNLDPQMVNCVVNKTLLSKKTNVQLGGDAPSVYLSRMQQKLGIDEKEIDKNVSSHLISVADLRADDFDAFFRKRSESLLAIIAEAMGKPVIIQEE